MAEATLPDLVAPGLDVVFCGINPSLKSAAVGHHFAGPGNRFWPTLHGAGFTPRLLRPGEDAALLALGIGIASLVPRATARADELSVAELREGATRVTQLVGRLRPGAVAMLGITAYRSAFRRPRAVIGRQPEPIAGRPLWVLPNPSGLNAHWQLPALVAEFSKLRDQLHHAEPPGRP